MEPSDQSFARSYHFRDQYGENIDLGSSIGGMSSYTLGSSTRHHHASKTDIHDAVLSFSKTGDEDIPSASRHKNTRRKQLMLSTRASKWSQNTLVQSVLLADGLVATSDDEEENLLLLEIPGRYDKASVKSKITWFGVLCLTGVGMFVEAYVIITTGQVKTVWHDNYPTCWDSENEQPCPNNIECCGLFPNTPQDVCQVTTTTPTPTPNEDSICTQDDNNTYPSNLLCSSRQLGGVSYAEFAGIMVGMLVFGTIADRIGRKKAGTLTALLMIVGIGGMTFFDSKNVGTLFLLFSIFFAIFGLGVGGEYPLTATQAAEYHAENAENALLDDEERRHQRILVETAKTARRGETIALVFAMQGVGAVVGSVFLLALIYFSNQTRTHCDQDSSNSRGADQNALESIWRSFYFIGLIFVCMLFIYRSLVLEESEGYNMILARRLRREQKLGKDIFKKRWWRIFWFYSPRLVGTGGNWFVWDVTFYGLKLFSGPIFRDINPDGHLVVQNGLLLVNNLCALAGYYCAAAVIDRPTIGRKKLQIFSFSLCAIIFMTTAAIFDSASSGVVMFLFFASSFFGNFGANVTTYVMAAETYPTELRGTFHGLSAYCGKLGALLANIGFGFLSSKGIFWVCGACSVVGLVFTYLFSVDLTGVSLAEHDAQLELLYDDKLYRYKGRLNDRKHLSNFEVWTGRHGMFDPGWVRKIVHEEKTVSPACSIVEKKKIKVADDEAKDSDDLQ